MILLLTLKSSNFNFLKKGSVQTLTAGLLSIVTVNSNTAGYMDVVVRNKPINSCGSVIYCLAD